MEADKKTWSLQLKWRSAPNIGNLSVWTFPLRLDESITPFEGGKGVVFPDYRENEGQIQFNSPVAKRLDAEFYLDEFMKLDPSDTPTLVNFMSTYGIITNLYRDPLTEPMRASVSVTPLYEMTSDGKPHKWPSTYSEEAQAATKEMHDAINAAHHNILKAATLFFPKNTYRFAPIEECSSSAEYLQKIIKMLINAKTSGSQEEGVWLSIDVHNTEQNVSDIVNVVNPYFPLVRMVPPKERDAIAKGNSPYSGAEETVTLPATVAILTQLLIGLSKDEGYKVCPVCGRTFMYKRGKAGTVARRSNSTYCSDYCQRKANHDKDARKNHARKSGHSKEGGGLK